MTDVKLAVSAGIDTAGLEADIKRVTDRLNQMGQMVATANRVKYNPIDRAALEDIKTIDRQFKEIARLPSALRDRLKASGQASLGFADIDFGKLYTDPAQAARARATLFNRVTAGTAFGKSLGPPPQASTGLPKPQQPAAPQMDQPLPPPSRPGPERWGQGWGARIINSGLSAAGPVGNVASGALSEGASGGLMAGLGGLLGGLAALGVGKVVGAVAGKIGDAQNEGISTDTLKRSLGDLNVDFVTLRDSVRLAADGLQLTYNEAQKVASAFVRVGGTMSASELSKEMLTAGGFSRSFGLDPTTAPDFFARMRGSGITSNDSDSKRMAINIAEAIGRSNLFSRTDEVLHAVASFAEQTAANSLTRGNSGAYLNTLTSISGSGLAGMTPGFAAALLSRANSAIEHGGAAGEAGQNFLYRALNPDGRMSPFEVSVQQDAGLFATRSSVFGPGSLYNRTTGRTLSGNQTTFDSIRAQLSRAYSDPRLRTLALSSLTGLNASQAMALDQFAGSNGGVGGLASFLESKNIDLSKVNANGLSALGKVYSGSMSDVRAQADSLRNRTGSDALSPEERAALEKAAGSGDDKALRDIVTTLTAQHSQEMTEGEETRKSIVEVGNITQRAATMLVAPMNIMRDALIYLAGGKTMTGGQISDAVRALERKERAAPYDAKIAGVMSTSAGGIDASRSRLNRLMAEKDDARRGSGKYGRMSGAERSAAINDLQRQIAAETANGAALTKARDEQVAAIAGERDASLASFDNQSGNFMSGISASKQSMIRAAAQKAGVDPNAMAAVLRLEGSGANSTSPKGARGEWQIMPGNVPKGGDPTDFGQGASMAAKVFQDAQRLYPGDIRAQIAYYNGGKAAGDAVAAGGSAPSAETQKYLARYDAMAAGNPMPGPAGSTGSNGQTVTVKVTADPIVLQDGKGTPKGSVALSGSVSKPSPAGAVPAFGGA